jgi:hypothetical protein
VSDEASEPASDAVVDLKPATDAVGEPVAEKAG